MTSPEIAPTSRPDDDQLDRLRAGLLDGTRQGQTLAAHLADCAHCRGRLQRWERLARTVFADDDDAEGLRRAWRERTRASPEVAILPPRTRVSCRRRSPSRRRSRHSPWG